MTKRRQVSDPLLALLQQADIQPNDVDVELDRRIERGSAAVLRRNNPFVDRVRRSSGLGVVGILRRHRRLLVEIEHCEDHGDPIWMYHERNATDARFSCKGGASDTVLSALSGLPLHHLISPHPALAGLLIDEAAASTDGWINVAVTPAWQNF